MLSGRSGRAIPTAPSLYKTGHMGDGRAESQRISKRSAEEISHSVGSKLRSRVMASEIRISAVRIVDDGCQ